jgi:hypothetical protein
MHVHEIGRPLSCEMRSVPAAICPRFPDDKCDVRLRPKVCASRLPEIDVERCEVDTMEYFFAIPGPFSSKWVEFLPTNLPAGLQLQASGRAN